MGLFKISKAKEMVQEKTGGDLITRGGIYDIVINWASVEESKNGAVQVNFNINYNDNEQVLYGPYVQDKDGKTLQFGMRIINNLGIIAGLEEGQELEIAEEEHTVGKDKEVKTFQVLTDFTDLPCKVKVRERYSKHPSTGDIVKRLEILKFFAAEDGATAEEIVNGTDYGKQYEYEKDKPVPPKYEDGLTEEDVKAWYEAKKKEKDGNDDAKNSKKAESKAGDRTPRFRRR